MLLTVLLFGALGAVAFGLRSPWSWPRLAKATAGGLALGAVLAYFNVYPGSIRGILGLLAVALILAGVQFGVQGRASAKPLIPRAPLLGVLLIVMLVALAVYPYTSWGAKSVDNEIYADLNTRHELGPAPALTDPSDVRVVPWDLAGQLLARDYREDASFLTRDENILLRNTYPDTVNGEFLWVNAPVPLTAKWLLGGLRADKVLYVRNDASDLTSVTVAAPLKVQLDANWWHDRVGRYAENEGELRYVLQDVALQLDDDLRPHWIAYLAYLDLRGQAHLAKLVVIDAETGEESVHAPADAPAWIEIVYPERYVYDWAKYWGAHREGFFYRWLNATGLTEPDDLTVRYIRLENKTYWLLPMKQLQSHQLGGYVLMDTRTGEATFYDRSQKSLIDYDTALQQLQAIMASGEATRGAGAIRLAISEGYLYPILMKDGTVRDAYVFPLLEGLKVSRFAVIDAQDFTTRRVFASSISDAIRGFSDEVGVLTPGNATTDALQRLRVVDGTVDATKALVNLNGTLYRVTVTDLGLGQRHEAEREMDELQLAISRANRGLEVELDVLVSGGRVLDVRYPDVSWAS